MGSQPDATGFLTDLVGGDRRAADRLLPLVYGELHELAEGYLGRERRDHTLQPTALVHEAYLRLVDQSRVDWQGKAHFKAVAALAMRRMLVDHGRARKREKRGGSWRRVTLHDAFVLAGPGRLEVMALHEALRKMHRLDERQARVVEYRLFGGLSSEEISRLLGVSERTVDRDWKMGQAWLRRELSRGATA
jgi:RNA polymerase sigma-70 factor (ECF subfamily)